MNNNAFTDWFNYLVQIILLCINSFEIILSFPKKGIFLDPKIKLQAKTVKELKSMLAGHRTSNLKKDELIDLILTLSYSTPVASFINTFKRRRKITS